MVITIDQLQRRAERCRALSATALTAEARAIFADLAVGHEVAAREASKPAVKPQRPAFVWPDCHYQ